jgi:hypothetical protein
MVRPVDPIARVGGLRQRPLCLKQGFDARPGAFRGIGDCGLYEQSGVHIRRCT